MAPKKGTPIASGIVARATALVSGTVAGAIRGAATAWFGPGEPMAPVAPEDVRGRARDIPFGFNMGGVRPRSEPGEGGVDFAILRQVADPAQGGLDLLRLAIETRKDQMEGQRWKIQARDGKGDGGKRAREVEKAFRRPDGVLTHAQWQRQLLEDLFVIDAPTVYLRPQAKGGDKLPEVMDGATLKKLINGDGRTPLPPEPAYQQVLVGMPAVNYSLAEIVQLSRNLRPNKVYGMSPVEQVVTTIDIALRRQQSQREYYTAGSIPDAVANVPEGWGPDQIKQYQEYWDFLLSGETAERRKLRFIPGGVGIHALLPEKLKDEFDEWVARVICYAFSLSPQAFVKQMNRATSETAKEAAQEEGLEPVKLWWKDLIDLLLELAFNEPELELAWADEEIVDPTEKATVFSTALGAGGGKPFMTVDEVREKFGLPPLTPEQKEELMPPPSPRLDPSAGEDSGDGSGDGQGAAPEPPAAEAEDAEKLRKYPGQPRNALGQFDSGGGGGGGGSGGTGGSSPEPHPPPPWPPKGTTGSPGIEYGKPDPAVSPGEARVMRKLVNEGRNLRWSEHVNDRIPEGWLSPTGDPPTHKANSVEVKCLDATDDSGSDVQHTCLSTIRKSLRRDGQSPNIIIDGTARGLTKKDAEIVFEQARAAGFRQKGYGELWHLRFLNDKMGVDETFSF